MKEKLKDIAVRAIKTFVQGFLGALAVTLTTTDLNDGAVLNSVIIGAIACGLSAVMNLFVNLMKDEEE